MPIRETSPAADGSELSLVHAVASGDPGACAELFEHYGEAVLRFVYRRVGEQMEDAEEVALDTFASAVRLAGSYDGRSSVFTWLCGIAKLRIIDYHRRMRRNKRTPPSAPSLDRFRAQPSDTLDHVLDRIESEQVVELLLAGLSEDEREVLLLRYVDQFSVREIAQITGRSEKGVEGLLTRAKNKPKAFLQRWLEEDLP
jgi:RNA polymerase sigma-70 factor, ECF subfamily